jgi:hypothetical protein
LYNVAPCWLYLKEVQNCLGCNVIVALSRGEAYLVKTNGKLLLTGQNRTGQDEHNGIAI